MKNFIKYILIFGLGAILMFFILKSFQNKTQKEASHTIAYGIERLNKLVVAEQVYSNFYTHESSTQLLGEYLSFDKNLTLQVTTEAQASYDLSKMKVEIDSANQIIHIMEIPELDIKTTSDVHFADMNQSMLNQFSKEDMNGIKSRAIREVNKKIDLKNLEKEAHEQLLHNLEEIYLLAKIYGWKVQDDTEFKTELEAKMQF